jgi:hypothetical protein
MTIGIGATRALRPLAFAAAALAGMTSSGAYALDYIEETSATISAFYGMIPPGNEGEPTYFGSSTAPTGSYNVFDPTPGNLGNARLDYTVTTGANGAFFFHHNLQCVGACEITLTTRVVDKITNTGSDPLNLRFDSTITPGHAGYQGIDGFVTLTYQVVQYIYDASGTMTDLGVLYNTIGGNSSNPDEEIGFVAGSTPFNGLTRYTNGLEGAYDWGETNVNFDLKPIGVGGYAEVVLYTATRAVNRVGCDALDNCGGVQIVFGDPRKDGTVTNLTNFATTDSGYNPLTDDNSVIGRQFDAGKSYIRVVEQGSPLPPAQTPFVAPTYTPGPFASGTVPEPASWAMLIAGFGLLGGTVRRRRALVAA